MSHPIQSQEAGQALVITRDKSLSRLIAGLLESEGYETIECADNDEIENCMADPSPAVIVVDEAVAPDSPLDLCRAIRQLPGCDYIPLLLLSDKCDKAAEERAYDQNVTTIIVKPIDQDRFRKRIRSLGDTGRTLSGMRALRTPESDVLQSMPDAFFVAGKDGLLRQYLGGANDDPVLLPEDIEGQMISDVWPANVTKQVLQNIKRVLRSREGHTFEFALQQDGKEQSYEMRLLVQGRDKVLMVIRNITDSPGNGTRSQDRDSSDTLTGLTTRDVFMGHFNSLIADAKLRERGIAVFCIDIDRFGRINDTLGRAVGDAVLKVTAQRIERCLRSSDKLARISDDVDSSSLTRISGDEFVLILADIESRENVGTVASRVQEAFVEPVTIQGHKLNISPSIGISLYPLDGDNADDLLKNSRVALDEAKVMSVDGREFFSSTMKYRSLKRFDVKNELRWAIEKGQLELHYLPRFDLTTGHVAGLEALLRWMHPLRGSVPLSEVIPLAEATGLIFPIGEWVLRTACEQAYAWYQEDPDAPAVSVNLSQQEFTRNDIVELIGRSLEESGLPPNLLELELTEGMLTRNRQADAMLRDLSKIGVGIVLDDFGQGHSSIAHLTSLPIKAIKIDRAFIDGIKEPGEKQAICSAMIAMSRELGISVIAEGVESQLQVEFLRERGCDAVQGFLYTEPLPVDEVAAFLTACEQVLDETSIIDLNTVR
ncbi:MAG: EAL domain-containing protein, partial [Gammaproteobacteria bacterium]|nr:EAL domain-containing protein [Gammaproteobacteria bacterium]